MANDEDDDYGSCLRNENTVQGDLNKIRNILRLRSVEFEEEDDDDMRVTNIVVGNHTRWVFSGDGYLMRVEAFEG